MRRLHYPTGTVRALLDTDAITDATRQVLASRLAPPPYEPMYFTPDEYALLRAVSDRLIPQDDHPERVDIVRGIDERLALGKSNGWRYDEMPADGDAYRLGLTGIDETAQALFQRPFSQLAGEQQDAVLKAIQTGEASGITWQTLPADRFFEELLTEAVENYYSHPVAQEEIGYVGMADRPSWQRIGLNQLEDREPKEIKV